MDIHETLNLNEELLLNIVGKATNLYGKANSKEGEDDTFYDIMQWAFMARRVLAETGRKVESPIFDKENWWVCANCHFDNVKIYRECHGCNCIIEFVPETEQQMLAAEHLSNLRYEAGLNHL